MLKYFVFLALLFPATVNAETSLARIFRDHMVLQRGMDVPVWGWSETGTKITVQFAGQSKSTMTADDGHWMVRLDALKASAMPGVLTVESGGKTITVKDVLVGEVWLASGQSNMGFTVGASSRTLPAAKELIRSNYPLIRVRRVQDREQAKPLKDLATDARWTVCSPETVKNFSAVAFLFARRLHDELNVPVGFIDSSWGGKPIEPYIPREAFKGHPTLEKLGELADKNDLIGVKKIKGGTYARSAAWLAGRIYNGRIAPTVPYAVRGAIWYQAESNCGRGEDPRDYQHKMKALMAGWRMVWNQERFPIYYVQLPRHTSYGWTFMRDQQRRAMEAPDCGMAVTHDLKLDGIHPANKFDVAERLALWPLAKVYGKDVICSGPLYRSHEIKDSIVEVSFGELGGGLMVADKVDLQPTRATPDATLFGFELAAAEGKWLPGNATIQDDKVTVVSPGIDKPIAVRYAMHPMPPRGKRWNLYNKAGLPASPFCSDPSLMHWVSDEK